MQTDSKPGEAGGKRQRVRANMVNVYIMGKHHVVPEHATIMRAIEYAGHQIIRGAGCRDCQGTGYRGRTCIMELMPVTEGVRALILRRASGGEIRRQAVKEAMKTLRDDGWRHVIQGHTTVEEVLRVTKDERAEAEAAAPAGWPDHSKES